jgi:hypothetical protein
MNPESENTNFPPVEEQMTKNLIIGIGGTGLSAIRELRRLIAERYEKGLDDQAASGVRFIYIDTDSNYAGTKTNWSVLGKDISMKEGEKVGISGDRLGPMVKNPKDYADVVEWLPAISDYVGQPGEGAKGIRPYGRLIYNYSANRNKVKDAVISARDSLNAAMPHEPGWRIYIVCSLSGGTGSGMFLPLAHDLVDWGVFQRDMATQKLRGFFVLPPLMIVGRHDRYHANAFAALRELNFQGVEGTLPFSSTYLVEPINAAGNEIGIDNLPLLIAQRLFLNIQSGPAAAAVDGLMDNPNVGQLEGDDTRRRHALCFSSFGLSTVSYPRETIARSVALEWAAGAAANWLQEQHAPQNVNQVVRNDLPKLHLSRLHVDGDGDPFGNNDFPPHDNELPSLVDGRIDPLAKRQLAGAGHKIREDIETGFRNVGIEAFYQQREKDASRAAEYAMERVRLTISRQIRDVTRGVRFAKEYLEELRKILEGEFKPEAADRFGENALRQVSVFQINYGETVNVIAQHEQAFVYWDSEYARDKANMSDELKSYLRKKSGYWSGKYATTLLDRVIPAVQKLRDELDVWHSRLTETLGKVRGRLQMEIDGRGRDARENGTVIFDMELLRKVAHEAPKEVVYPAIEARLTAKLAELNKAAYEDLDLFILGERSDADELLEKTAYEYILSPESPLNVRRTTLYDRFISEYPTPKARQELLARTARLSEVFVRSVPEEVGRRPVHAVNANRVSIPNVIGRQTKDGQEPQTVIRQDLVSAGIPDGEILATDEVERILFIREMQAFPVRFVESVKRLKQYYDKFPIKEALHIDKREVGQLYDLFLLSEGERTSLEAAEETFLLARALGWTTPYKNQQTLKPEIRYEYEIPGKIGMKAAAFGPDWDTAFERFTQDSIAPTAADSAFREGRLRLTERVAAARADAKTQPEKWSVLFEAMKTYLNQTMETYRARMDDPRHRRDQEIINRIVEKQDS